MEALRTGGLKGARIGVARDVTGFLTMTFLAIAAMALVWSVAPRGPDYRDMPPTYAPQMDPYTGAITWVAER